MLSIKDGKLSYQFVTNMNFFLFINILLILSVIMNFNIYISTWKLTNYIDVIGM